MEITKETPKTGKTTNSNSNTTYTTCILQWYYLVVAVASRQNVEYDYDDEVKPLLLLLSKTVDKAISMIWELHS